MSTISVPLILGLLLLLSDSLVVQKALAWLQNTELDAFWAGLIFEQLWSYIFGAGVEYAHPAECTVFACNQGGAPATPSWEAISLQRWNPRNNKQGLEIQRTS